MLSYANYSKIIGNIVYNNTGIGIDIEKSKENMILGNTVNNNNNKSGIRLWFSNKNIVIGNIAHKKSHLKRIRKILLSLQ